MENQTWTVKQVADYLRVHPDTIYTMVKEKQIPHFRVRSKIFFTKSAIDSWIRSQEGVAM
ncbi:DNA-binding protein [Domibacillus antri]|uniref:DNA-binding protein n=1 Tax=Domibacillus antri TaxID=1714264 RepID=A0A1Q8Q955_9BACI|nr:helix-turn-helix domain-containing protein [Domibacillus antri]OLN23873.1 DNA-binding protein [Domibacillus antri]